MRNYQDLVVIMKWVAFATGVIGLRLLKQSLFFDSGSIGVSGPDNFKFAEVLIGMGLFGFFGFGWMQRNLMVQYPIGSWKEWGECLQHVFENAREADQDHAPRAH